MAAGGYRKTLQHVGVRSFLWTQFLGALNDNVFKIIVSFYAIGQLGEIAGVAAAGAVFVAPFLLFSGYAGHLADAQSKRSVLIWTKSLEIVAMVIAIPALLTGRIPLLLAVLFLMAVQATFFSPAKYGIIPEMLPESELSRANGLLEMSTFAAIVLGTSLGGELFQRWHARPAPLASVLVAVAIIGTLTSFGIPRVAAGRTHARFSWNPFGEIGRGLARLYPDKTLWMTMIGISYFWFLGALLQFALIPFGQDAMHLGAAAATRLYTWLAIGIAAGSLLAGRLSGNKIEPGLVPLGSFGLGAFSLVLAASTSAYWIACASLLLLGVSGGFFAVPLNAILQDRPAADEKGRVLATNNFMNTIGILLATGVLFALSEWAHLSIRAIVVVAGLFTLLSSVYVLATLQEFFVRFTLWLLTHTIYRIKIVGRPNIPTRGPALLICNHVSMIDGALVGACVQRFVRFLVYGPYFQMPVINWIMRRLYAIPITPGAKSVSGAIERARHELAAGHVVCIFAEGSVSRTGNLLPFKRGFERMVEGLDVPVIPVYLDRVWGSIFSFKRGKFFWKLPERVPYPVTVAFGTAISQPGDFVPPDPRSPPASARLRRGLAEVGQADEGGSLAGTPSPRSALAGVTAEQARQAILELGVDAMRERRSSSDLLHTAFMTRAKRGWRRFAMADSTGQRLTYGRALVSSLLLSRRIRRSAADQEKVGVLLPASVGGALTNIAVLSAGKVPVNLNFTAGADAMQIAIDQCEIRTIVTSRRFLQKASIEPTAAMLFLEDLAAGIGVAEKLRVLLQARLLPVRWLRRRYGGRDHSAGSLATIIFSSGSTGVPKGVMISHANILANIDSLAQIFPMDRTDCFIGVLPFFHAFGLTGTLWFPLVQGSSVAYHPNPMDAKTIGELAERYRGTMLISTPTFCQAYLRRCTREQFAHLKYAIVGAEKLRQPLATAFREQFGVDLLEGYGCTEMSPVVAVNRPNVGLGHDAQIGTKPGSVGHPIPGVAVRVIDQATGEGPIVGREGLLLVKGMNLMQGYLGQPERTAEVMREGWYVTGDIGMVDEDGFVFITDRLSRFSKIGGEMVPHIKVEDTLNELLGEVCSAVTAIPDPGKGERLVAFYSRRDVAPDDLWDKLCQTELPRLWLPRRESLIPVDAIPTLGTGKVDLRRLRQLAIERFEEQPQESRP